MRERGRETRRRARKEVSKEWSLRLSASVSRRLPAQQQKEQAASHPLPRPPTFHEDGTLQGEEEEEERTEDGSRLRLDPSAGQLTLPRRPQLTQYVRLPSRITDPAAAAVLHFSFAFRQIVS